MKRNKLLSLLLSSALAIGIVPSTAFAENAAAAEAVVYLTVNNKGTLATANDGSVMMNKPVSVTDTDNDGKLTVDEALKAAHIAYNSADGYAAGTYGVEKLWGTASSNTLFFVNNAGLSVGVGSDTVSDGDILTASINSDDKYYADWYTHFDKATAEAETGEEVSLTLKGHLGMAYTDEDKQDVSIANAEICIWKDGKTEKLNKTTDDKGGVKLSFDEEGVYYITATGTVPDEVVTDWVTYETSTVDCPIIAPGCVVTVKGNSTAKPGEVTAELNGLTVNALSLKNAVADKNAQICTGADKEEVLSPNFSATEKNYKYTVNYNRDKVTLTPTVKAGVTAKVNGKKVQSGETSEIIDLNVGKNNITVEVSNGKVRNVYTVEVYRKSELYIKEITFDGGQKLELKTDGSSRAANFICDSAAKKINFTVDTNKTAEVKAYIEDNEYSPISGSTFELPFDEKNSIKAYIAISNDGNGVKEAQVYELSVYRKAESTPDAIESYLPAPGQFVNLGNSWGNPQLTLTDSGAVTLGAFGGNIVYRYDTPIKNDPKNPYGIDFIINGNCFKDNNGETSSSAAEPAAVMVSKDGNIWYELAGSEYYTAKAEKGYSILYKNRDTEFTGAKEISWEDCYGEYGTMPIVESHEQSYFPNPTVYSAYQRGIGKNDTYSKNSVSFEGTKIENGFYPFGYADSHSENESMDGKQVNPYNENHKKNYNGDGFDISWAVDSDGNPVVLDEVSYIKVYNPVLDYGESRGEISPEIKNVKLAVPNGESVGISSGLEGLEINGEAVALENGVYTYNVDGKNVDTLRIKPTAVSSNANIYVSNQRVVSGSESSALSAVTKLRIIVQEGEKEPCIYILNFTNVPTSEYNAAVELLKAAPGDFELAPDKEDTFEISVASGVSSVRLTAVFAAKRSNAIIKRNDSDEVWDLSHNIAGSPISLSKGKNEFTLIVTSENGEVQKEYTVVINRENSSSSSSANSITVKFSIIGDKNIISKRSVTVPKGSTVKYLTEMMLNNNGIGYTTNGIYISEINGLAEFDKGPNSGWMYRCNGYIADISYASKVLTSGDVIQWFYTEDYTNESDYESNWDKVNSSSGSGSGKNDNTEQPKPTETPQPEKPSATYSDVKADEWYFDAVEYVTKNKLFDGVTDTEFEPETNMTRAMLVTVLYRLDKSDSVSGENVFNDVPSDEWYTDAVIWATQNGIVNGITDTEFAPNDNLSREQMVTVLYRYAAMKGYDVTVAADSLDFDDFESVSDWAKTAMIWANKVGLIDGVSDTELSPSGTATRAQVATILMRFCGNIVK